MLIKRTLTSNNLRLVSRLFTQSKEVQSKISSQIITQDNLDQFWLDETNLNKLIQQQILIEKTEHYQMQNVQINFDIVEGLTPIVLAKPLRPKWVINDILSLGSVGALVYCSALGTFSYPILGVIGLATAAFVRRSWIQNTIDSFPILRQLWLKPNGQYMARLQKFTTTRQLDVTAAEINMNSSGPKNFACIYRTYGLHAILSTPILEGRWVEVKGQKCILPNDCHINSVQINKL